MPDREEGLLTSRQVKLDRLRQGGIDPYPPRFPRTCDAATAIADFEAAENTDAPEGAEGAAHISLAGRIVSMRTMAVGHDD